MRRGELPADPRSIVRSMKSAIQGNIVRALVELITNSDDSYTRLEAFNGKNQIGKVFIQFIRTKNEGQFIIRDFAEGMGTEEFESSIIKWGSATSGLKENIGVRGYFGQGAKDVLVTMKGGRIVSVKDGLFTECRLFIQDNKPMYELEDTIEVTKDIRKEHGIKENGTVAYFVATKETSQRIPYFETLMSELSNNYMLRKIMENPNRVVVLTGWKKGQRVTLKHKPPIGSEMCSKSFDLIYKNYESFKINLSVWRSDHDLQQSGDDRDGGLLILDENDVVLDISLFKYDNEPLASRFFGEIVINGFRKLLIYEEAVLSDKRDGLEKRNPFCKELTKQIEVHLEPLVKLEEKRRRGEEDYKRNPDELRRYKSAVNILNQIAETEIEVARNLSTGGKDIYPKNGICLLPESASISVGKKYVFELRYDTTIIKPGTKLSVSINTLEIKVNVNYIVIPKDESEGIHSRSIIVEPQKADITAILTVTSGNRETSSKISVMGEKAERQLLFEEGVLFEPMSVIIRPNKKRKVKLKVYTKLVITGTEIMLTSDNPNIEISTASIVANEFDADRNVALYEIEVWGSGIGQDALITAEHNYGMALLSVSIRSKEEKKKSKPRGMFSEPEFSGEIEPLQASSYSRSLGKVIIYTNFPTVKHYLGDESKYRQTLAAQIRVADIIANRCFNEMARARVERTALVLDPEAKADRIQREANDLANKYGIKVLKALVDQKQLKEHQSTH